MIGFSLYYSLVSIIKHSHKSNIYFISISLLCFSISMSFFNLFPSFLLSFFSCTIKLCNLSVTSLSVRSCSILKKLRLRDRLNFHSVLSKHSKSGFFLVDILRQCHFTAKLNCYFKFSKAKKWPYVRAKIE